MGGRSVRQLFPETIDNEPISPTDILLPTNLPTGKRVMVSASKSLKGRVRGISMTGLR
jgi:hypothetical protein